LLFIHIALTTLFVVPALAQTQSPPSQPLPTNGISSSYDPSLGRGAYPQTAAEVPASSRYYARHCAKLRIAFTFISGRLIPYSGAVIRS